jgi:hypothetical protein
MGDAPTPLPCLPPGWESEWATSMARPLAAVLGEGAGPHTLPDDREPTRAETPRPSTGPVPLHRGPRRLSDHERPR